MEAGKCYKVSSPFSDNVYILKIKSVTGRKNFVRNSTFYGFEIKITKGFKVINNSVEIMNDTAFPESYVFQEIEENDFNKLEHYYNIMIQSFKAIINKYK